MNDNEFKTFKTNISRMIYKVLSPAKYSHEIIFDDSDTLYEEKNKELMAGLFVNQATSYANTAKLYYLSFPDYERSEFDNFFNKFEIYKNEILTNIRTDHSHQWTDINYREFAKSTQTLADLLNMDVEHFYKDL